MIDKSLEKTDDKCYFENKWPVADGYQKAVILAVQQMNVVAKKLRKQRESHGAL